MEFSHIAAAVHASFLHVATAAFRDMAPQDGCFLDLQKKHEAHVAPCLSVGSRASVPGG